MKSDQLSIFILILVGLVQSATLHANEVSPVFERDVLPIMDLRCGKCHSDSVQKGGLDLSTIRGLRKGGESGEGVIAESLDDSLLWNMVDDGDMPPKGQTPLTEKERTVFRRWIETGAASQTTQHDEQSSLTLHDALPILLLRCTVCHGGRIKKGGQDLRSLASMQHGGANGPAFVSGDPDSSLMIQRIESEACPPRESLLAFFVKRPPASELAKLREWIAAGVPEGDINPDIPTTEPDRLVTDEDRKHWSFQPPSPSEEPQTLDAFILKRLTLKGLTFSPAANRDTLIRRAYLDLIGMPPSREERNRWLDCQSPDWYAEMIEHLLASSHYGERWGRYWLDIAGYSDSEGGISTDPIREVAWKYRDYVIKAFNNDKPYDQFLIEQIAGDELIDHENADTITEPMVENLVATGFLRMGIDQTGSRTMNYVPERIGVVADAIAIVGSGVMGLTLECAKCHSHKYDPIPHRDYYRFKAIFQGALDEHDWLSFKNRSVELDTPDRRKRVSATNPPLTAEINKLEAQKRKEVVELQMEILRHHYPDLSESDYKAMLAARKVSDNNRTLQQRLQVEQLQRAELIPDSEQPPSIVAARQSLNELARKIADVRRRMEPPMTIRALWDRGDPSPTYILRRGEYDRPGPLVGPGVPSALTDGQTPFQVEPPFPDGTKKTGRRLAFAHWLTQPNNPLTARVMVNRVWYHHFGSGLVRSLENFGVKGERPTHPKLLDWLAVEFVNKGWSIKELHRIIMNSQTYRQTSHVTPESMRLDPQNKLLSRMPLRRLDAEALYDSLLFVSGALDETPFGPPDSVSVDPDGLVSVNPTSDGRWRRGVFAQYRRTETPTLMETFDYPEMGPNCVARSVSTVSPQPLLMLNNAHVRELASLLATRIAPNGRQAKPEPQALAELSAQIEAVFETALSRLPSDEERRVSIQSLQELRRQWNDRPDAALETFCHTILNSAAFVFID